MELTERQAADKLAEYENFVWSTVRYWRSRITMELEDDDIAQELRLKIYKALLRFDPEKSKDEQMHVFVAVASRIKDLIRYTNVRSGRVRVDSGEEGFHTVLVMASAAEGGMHRRSRPVDWRNGGYFGGEHQHVSHKQEFLNGLDRKQSQVCIMILQGYSLAEVRRNMGMTQHTFEQYLSGLRVVLRETLLGRAL